MDLMSDQEVDDTSIALHAVNLAKTLKCYSCVTQLLFQVPVITTKQCFGVLSGKAGG